jgi:hypothetical protein
MLRIYVSAYCRGCDTARQRAARLHTLRPDLPLALVDVEEPDADLPRNIIGVPMYTWHERVVFRGNPSEQELLECITVLQNGDESGRAG